ncbi:NAD(P)-binding protein [Chiua virens]|nr:NAD(P)-binding protein [Chiua virens]
MLSNTAHPIIIVTGANTGVGFGICQRLLFQLTLGDRTAIPNEVELECDALTLILACRNKQRAESARAKLCDMADEHVRVAKCSPDYDGRAETFRKNLHIAIHTVDLADTGSIFHFADEVARNYPYVSHLVCNAGVARFARIIWPQALYQLFTDWIGAVTAPRFYLQHVGDMSQEGLGWVWQCNVFGHYAMFRALEPMLAKCMTTGGARVAWISSHEASSEFYDPQDWQLVKSEHSYECSKYQMNMISLYLDREAARGQLDGTRAVRHLTAYPGVVGTSIASAMLSAFQTFWMFVGFYVARLLGSPNHPIDIFKGAISAVYTSLVDIASLPTSTNREDPVAVGTAWVSRTNRWGREYVGTTQFVQSQEEQVQTEELLEKCDRLLKTFCDVQGRKSPSG